LLLLSAGFRPFTAGEGDFEAPTIQEFYPAVIAFEGTPFEINRIMLIRLLVMTLLLVLFTLWAGKFRKSTETGQVCSWQIPDDG